MTPEELTFARISFKLDQNRTDFTVEELKMLEQIGKLAQEGRLPEREPDEG